jgi:hypothetical protein
MIDFHLASPACDGGSLEWLAALVALLACCGCACLLGCLKPIPGIYAFANCFLCFGIVETLYFN